MYIKYVFVATLYMHGTLLHMYMNIITTISYCSSSVFASHWLVRCVKIYLASMAKNEERKIWDVIVENDELRPVGDMIMAMLMEDVDSEYVSQNGSKA